MPTHCLSLKDEARLLSGRIGLRPVAIAQWMRSAGLRGIPDLMARYPDSDHTESMQRAAVEIENFILEGATPND